MKSRLGGDRKIEISINDTGPGLPLGKVDQIFDAFFTTKPQGSGEVMGLAICKSIVESHGGRIWADGARGHGATFHFTLPLRLPRKQTLRGRPRDSTFRREGSGTQSATAERLVPTSRFPFIDLKT